MSALPYREVKRKFICHRLPPFFVAAPRSV